MAGDSEDQRPEALVHHLKDLVDSYEELVQDMSNALSKNKEELKALETEYKIQNECPQCGRLEMIVANLKNQIENLSRAKKLATSLWHSSVEQIERLETRLNSTCSKPGPQLGEEKSSIDDQIKLFQTYISRLEARIEQTSSEKNFYRRKLIESKMEHETALKKMTAENSKEISVIKASYSREIEHVKTILEKERQAYHAAIDKRLEDSRKFWASEEKQRRETLKKNWLAQIEPVIVEQERLVLREAQLSERLYQTQQELMQMKQLMWNHSVRLPVQPVLSRSDNSNDKNERSDVTTNRTRNCDHEECVKYSMHLKVLQENERLGEEITSMRRARETLTADHHQITLRLEQRIRDLETLNHSLQEKLMNMNTNSTLQPKLLEPTSAMLPQKFRNTEKVVQHSLKSREHAPRSRQSSDPVLGLIDEFSQLCSLPSSSSKKNLGREEQTEDEVRLEHIQHYARELQTRNHVDGKIKKT